MISRSPTVQRRALSGATSSGAAPTALHFYTNRQLELYDARKANKLSLRQLVFFGRAMNEERLIKTANYVRTELPVRMAHRIRDLQSLPYVVVTEKNMWGVYEAYWSAFERFRRYPEIRNMEENKKFCQFLGGLLKEHLPMIPQLSLALSISSPHLAPEKLDSFMRRMLTSRISRRVLVEHHVALTEGLYEQSQGNDDSGAPKHVGIIYTNLSVKDSIDKCIRILKSEEGMYGLRRLEEPALRGTGIWPEIVVDGHLDARFPYIKEHLEYIIFELLKNAIRMTALRMKADPEHVPGVITATIAANENSVNIRISDQGGGLLLPENQHPSNLFSFSHLRNATRMNEDRLSALHRMTEHGFPITINDQLSLWQQEQLEKQRSQSQGDNASREDEKDINRMGLGLPLSNTYARYFGGSLDLMSLDGWGVDVYLQLPRLGTNLESIEI